LDTGSNRIDFYVECKAKELPCPICAKTGQRVHDRLARKWRHLDFFQYEAWVHAKVPRVDCEACEKTTQVEVPWARSGSGFTLLFEALALTLCKHVPVAQAGAQLRAQPARLWRSLKHYVKKARNLVSMADVSHIGIDETSAKKGHEYITVVHDLKEKRLLFATPGRSNETLVEFKADLLAHGGNPNKIKHVCMDMGPAYIKGVTEQLPEAEISFDRFHVVAMVNDALNDVRREEMRNNGKTVREQFGEDKKIIKQLRWAVLKNPEKWRKKQMNVMYVLQRSRLKTARAWRLKEALRDIYYVAADANCAETAQAALTKWISWAKRSKLEPFKKVAASIKEKMPGIIRGMLDGRSNAYVEALNGMLQQAKTAARGFRNVNNFITIAYLRMGKLKDLPTTPFLPAKKRRACVRRYVGGSQVPYETS
jgi:transposase